MSIKFAARVAALICALFGATPLLAHEGRDHAAAPPAIANMSPRAEAESPTFELVAAPKDGQLEIWLDRFATNEPVEGATIFVETPDGPVEAKPEGDVYRAPAAWAAKPGRYDLIFTVSAGNDMDVLATSLIVPPPAGATAAGASAAANPGGKALPYLAGLSLLIGAAIPILFRDRRRLWAPAIAACLVIVFGAASLFAHDGHDHDATTPTPTPASGDRSGVLADGSIFLAKPSQRILAVRTRISENERHALAVELPARVIPDPNASGLVQTATAGRLSPPPGGFPRLGAKVRKGDVLAYVTFPFLAIDQSTLHQTAGELDQQIAVAEMRVARYEILIKTQAVAQATLDEARATLDGMRRRRGDVDRVKREPEPLVAPVDGVIASANAAAGQIADANAVVFQIVDPQRLRVEAMDFDPQAYAGKATARTAEGKTFGLDFVGAGLADRNQATPIDFALRPGQAGGLRLGQFVTVSAELSGEKTGVAVPRASVVRRSNGQNVVFEHVRAEIFVAREVRVEPLDGDNVVVVAGFDPGKRVVTQAAALLDQAR
jgi:membrane fusion protein, heavy metal efflux system